MHTIHFQYNIKYTTNYVLKSGADCPCTNSWLQSSSLRNTVILALVFSKSCPPSSATLRLTDLGSGNGHLFLDASNAGYSARGFQRNPWRVFISRYRPWLSDSKTATFHRQCLWTSQLHNEDVVVLFGLPSSMERIGVNLQNECKSEACIISNTFRIPGWKQRSWNQVFTFTKSRHLHHWKLKRGKIFTYRRRRAT